MDKDFTPRMAALWVEQEAAKATTIEQRCARIIAERNTIAFCIKAGRDKTHPNSFKAHSTLIDRLFVPPIATAYSLTASLGSYVSDDDVELDRRSFLTLVRDRITEDLQNA